MIRRAARLTFMSIVTGAALYTVRETIRKNQVGPNTILVLNLENGLPEVHEPSSLFRFFGPKTLDLKQTLDALERAEKDPKVVGLVCRLQDQKLGLAVAQEIRDAITAFRTNSDKFTIAYTESFGDSREANEAYFVASACEKVFMQPSGLFSVAGVAVTQPFLRGTLDKLGIVPRLFQRKEFKNAANQLTETKFTPSHRLATEHLMNYVHNTYVKTLANGRQIKEAAARKLLAEGPYTPNQAVQKGLLDDVMFSDQVEAFAKSKAGKDAKIVKLVKYVEATEPTKALIAPSRSKNAVGLIYGSGTIVQKKLSDSGFNAREIVSAIRDAVEDEDIKAIVLRVDSPGGGYAPSDAVWRAIIRAKEAGKPVVVSMGNVAASGGYLISVAADKIIAQPGTITGSIGVFAGKFILKGLAEKLGVSVETLSTSDNARLFSPFEDYSPENNKKMQDYLDVIYEEFIAKVAQGRNLPVERVRELAKGRVWTGEDFKTFGMVDELGGLKHALNVAKDAGKIPAKEKLYVKEFGPSATKGLRQLLKKFRGDDQGIDSFNGSFVSRLALCMDVLQSGAQLWNTARVPVSQLQTALSATDPAMLMCTTLPFDK